jgi:hypothetical protein
VTWQAPPSRCRVAMSQAATGGDYPVTINQERRLLAEQWAASQRQEELPFHLLWATRLDGPLDRTALVWALDRLVARHAALRARFHPAARVPDAERESRVALFGKTALLAPGLFRQSIAPRARLTLEQHTIPALSPGEQPAWIQSFVDREAVRRFAYDRPPLLRASLIELGPREHVLLVLAHHLACDAAAMEILHRELALLYGARCDGRTLELPEPQVQFHEFAEWQHELLRGHAYRDAARYWADQWRRCEAHQLAYRDMPGALVSEWRNHRPVSVTALELGPEMSGAIDALARSSRVTTFMLWLGLFAVALGSVARRPSIALWGLFANRTMPGTLDTVGWFSEARMLGIDLHPNWTFKELMAHVRQVVLGAMVHHEFPMALLPRVLRRTVAFSDLRVSFDVVTHTAPRGDETTHGCRMIPMSLPLTAIEEAIDLRVHVSAGRLTLTAYHAADRFAPGAIERLLWRARLAAGVVLDDGRATLLDMVSASVDRDGRSHCCKAGAHDAVG